MHAPCRQSIVNGFQHEQPDYWLMFGNPWEIERLNVSYPISFYGHVSVATEGPEGRQAFKWNAGEQVRARCLRSERVGLHAGSRRALMRCL